MNFLSSVATFYKEGGPFMHAILATAVIIAAIVVERAIVIGRAAVTSRTKLTQDLVNAASRGDLNGARRLVAGSGSPLAQVAQSMLTVAPAEESALQSAADDGATLVMPSLTKRLAHLSVLANSATLLGLLGTIFGLMTAFSGVGAADPAHRSSFLAAGISQALNTTAFGLMVAVPTMVLQGWLAGRVEGIAEQIDELGIRLGRALAHGVGQGTAHTPALSVQRGTVVPQNRPATGTIGGGQ